MKTNSPVNVNGKGVIKSARFREGFLTRKVCLDTDNKLNLDNIYLDPNEWPEGILQKDSEMYLITSSTAGYGNGFVRNRYFNHEIPFSKSKKINRKEIINFDYESLEGKIILDNLYNGENEVPTAVFQHPNVCIGHNGAFGLNYSPITIAYLDSGDRFKLMDKAQESSSVQFENKLLLSSVIPASSVPSVISTRKSEPLVDVFDNDDLGLVDYLCHKKDREHRPNCYGNSSCIPTNMFEFVCGGFPAYKIYMDTKGKIYHAERIFD